ncbi:MAG: nitroreductase family protein [Solirubrobacteraceae bacterium]|nr:nitroreductase family protein [Solirubrobacteraceae bacterium]
MALDNAVLQAMRTVGTCRRFRPDPVPDEVLDAALEAARFAPQGGNLQPVRWLLVRDPALRRALRDLYIPLWETYVAEVVGEVRGTGARSRSLAAANHFADTLHEVPLIAIPCVHISSLWATDDQLGRLPIVGGASVYPFVQNFCLALRSLDVATAITTLLCQVEPELHELLDIPEDVGTACHIAVGYRERSWPTNLRRRAVADTTYVDRFGTPFAP